MQTKIDREKTSIILQGMLRDSLVKSFPQLSNEEIDSLKVELLAIVDKHVEILREAD